MEMVVVSKDEVNAMRAFIMAIAVHQGHYTADFCDTVKFHAREIWGKYSSEHKKPPVRLVDAQEVNIEGTTLQLIT